PGECVGAGSVMGGERRGVSIIATQPTEVLAIDGAGLLKLIDGSNGFAHRLLAMQSGNAQALGQQSSQKEMDDDFLSMMGNGSGLQDRAWLEEHLAAMTTQAQETNKPVSMLMISLDYIDNLIEWYDSSAAEEALDMTCGLIIDSLRPTDFTVRYSDNELAVLLPAANAEGAATVAQRLSERMKTTVVFSDRRKPLPMAASFGIACLAPHQNERDLIGASTAALMRARRAGEYSISM
ncbi:MAG TPA: diguanylate cyclase, partial [Burkholderiaceae bacterium]|nr:diguanylate cyclase [Burkholderiaceae bacterium]